MKKFGIISLTILIACLAIGLISLATMRNRASGAEDALPALTTHVLRVGKADAILLREGTNVMLIDAGEEDDGPEILEFLAAQGIDHIDDMIITHYDKDHVGGADLILENIKVSRVIVPDYVGTIQDYTEFVAALNESEEKNGTKVIKLTEDMEFSFGSADVLVEPPSSYEFPAEAVEVDNDFSLITTITHGKRKLLFMGDAEKRLIRSWLAKGTASRCDFIKIPHHGVYTAALSELLDRVQPSYAAICTSKKNPAESKTVELLNAYGVRVFETMNGNITIISDGNTLQITQ